MTTLVNKKIWNVSWVKNSSGEGGSQAYCLSNLKPGEICIASHTKKEGRLWANITPSDLINLIEKNHGIFEVIPSTFKRKVYFDIDGEPGLNLQEVKDAILTKFPNARMAISGSITLEKVSYHICLTNYFFKNQDAQKCLIHWLTTLPENLGFDTKVYTTNRLMKCANQSKIDGRVQEVHEPKSLVAHLILAGFDEDARDATELEFHKSLVQSFEYTHELESKLDILTVPQQALATPENFDLKTATRYQMLQILPNTARGTDGSLDYKVQMMIMCWSKQNGISFEDFWNWASKKDDSPERFEKYKKLWDEKDYRYSDKTIIELLKRFYPHIESRKNFVDDLKVFKTMCCKGKYLQSTDLESAFEKSRLVYVSLQMGRNKTGGTLDWIKSLPSKTRVIWLSTRISYAENVADRLKEIGFVNYKTLKDDFDKQSRLIISPQSFYKIGKAQYDVIVLDEVETIKSAWASDTTHTTKKANNLGSNWEKYESITRTASYCLLLDAIPNNSTVDFYSELRNEQAVILGSDEPLQDRVIREFTGSKEVSDNVENWKTSIVEKLKAGKNLFIFYPFKRNGETHTGIEQLAKIFSLAANIPESDYRTYHGDTSESLKRELGNVNDTWSKVRFVITNTAITVGVNFDVLEHFDEIYTNYPTFISPRDVIQNLGRIRQNIPINIVFSTNYSSFEFVSPDLIRRNSSYRQYMNAYMIEHFSRGKKYFKEMAKLIGCSFTPAKYTRDEVEFQRMIKIEKETECLFRWGLIVDLNENQMYDASQRADRATATMGDKLSLAKYFFRTKFEENTPDEVMELIWNQKQSGWCEIFDRIDDEPILKAMLGDTFTPGEPQKNYDFTQKEFTEFRDRINSRSSFIDNKITNHFQSVALKAIFGRDIWIGTKDRNSNYSYKLSNKYIIFRDYYLTWKLKPKEYTFIENDDV